MPTKAELESQLADRDADAPSVSVMIAAPIMCVGGLLMIAVLYLTVQRQTGASGTFSPYWLAIPGVVAWLYGHTEGAYYFAPQIYGRGPRVWARVLAAVLGPAASAWLVWTGQVGPANTWPHLALGALVATLFWWALLWYAERRARDPEPTVVTSTTTNVDHQMPWKQLLDRSTDGSVVITQIDYHRAGAKLTVEPGRFSDDDGIEHDEAVTFGEFARCAERFASLASREYRRRTGERMPLNCARPEEGADDAEFVLHVTMRDVFTEHSVFKAADSPQDIAVPKDLGEYEDATRIMVSLLSGHAKIVGATGSGKSVEANNWIARITECHNALVWICATDKLIPLIFPWLRSWFAGAATAPCLDYVAGLQIDNVLGMLADAYKLCCERNARLSDESKMTATSNEPAVFLFFEELSHSVEFTNTIRTHDGMECDVSTLLMLIARAGRSANVRLVLMSQTALNSSMGDAAAEIIRNLQIRVCLRTMESHDGYRTIPALNNVDTTTIPLYTKIVQPSIETTRAMPGKAPELDGSRTIDEVARRNAGWRPVGGVEAESRLGNRYVDRWNPRRLPELARAVEKHGMQWRIPNVLVGGTDAVKAWNIIEGGSDAPQGGGTAMNAWTDADDAAVAEWVDGNDDPQPRTAGGFRLPNGDREFENLKNLARDVVEHYGADEPGDDAQPLPTPLDEVIAWLDAEKENGATATFYLTEAIARGIGHPDHARLGRELFRNTGQRTRNALAHEDARKRKGYDVSTLREAATRIRFAL